ncbi:BTAD domain-containing putative transcriptional regulator [Actinosynnema sp. CS-041913]|uniref:BTAD domain-containing putative transcriptional regulator n=1 Tax=Actinosynnema sp. CS-041913 TaxID=3239917 RepID=UPI003D94CC9E
MQVRVLGPVDVLVNGTPRAVRGLRRKALLAVLALHAEKIVSTDRLIEAVWAGRPPATAPNTLQRHLSHLRGVLGDRTSIQARPPGYVLDIGADATDLMVAERLIRLGRQSTDPAASATHLRAALALWRDQALLDVAGLPWLDTQAERLASIRQDASAALIEARLALGEHRQLVPELERLSLRHRFDEHLHGRLMLALYRSGRQAEALAAYQRLRHALGDELGIDPSAALRDLEAAMLRQDVTLTPTTPPTALPTAPPLAMPPVSPPTPPTAVPIAPTSPTAVSGRVGVKRGVLEREREIAGLAGAAREAAAGSGSVVLVSGEAGIGKSSLVQAIGGLLPPAGRLLVGYCDDLATPRTLGPFRELAGSVDAERAGVLRDGGDRDRVLDAVHAELSRGRPTVLAVEDVHWADDATLDALSVLVRLVADLPAVLVLTYRDDLGPGHPLQRVLGQVARAPRVRRLAPARLSEAAVRELTAPSPLDPRQVHSVTGGNPFFVTEILASGETVRVPPTIVDAVLARVHGLDPGTREALDQLAVIPSTVDRRLLDAVLPGGIASVAAAEQRGLLTVTPTRTAFRHTLIRRAVVDSLAVARRVELNRRVLAALVEREDSDPSRIMHHAAEAGDRDAVVRYGPRAARDATRAGSHREAAAHLRLVLAYEENFDPAELADLFSAYAAACATIGDIPDAVTARRAAVDLRRTLGDRRKLGAELLQLSRVYWMAGEPELMERGSDESIEVLEAAGDDRLLAHALSHRSALRSFAWRNRESIEVGERALALARAVGDSAVVSHVLASIGGAQWQCGLPEARATLEESLSVARSIGSVGDICRATCNIVGMLVDGHRLDEAADYVTAAIELAEGAEHVRFYHHMHAIRSVVAFAAGRWDQAVADAELVITASPPVKAPTKCPALTVLGRVRVRRGLPGGEDLLADAWDLAQRTRVLDNIGPVAVARAEAAWLRDDLAAVAAVLDQVHAEASRVGAASLRAELGYWLTKAGRPVPPDDDPRLYARWAGGDWREAAATWRKAGRAYEHAAALADSPDPDDRRTALGILDELGAEPLAHRVRRTLDGKPRAGAAYRYEPRS